MCPAQRSNYTCSKTTMHLMDSHPFRRASRTFRGATTLSDVAPSVRPFLTPPPSPHSIIGDWLAHIHSATSGAGVVVNNYIHLKTAGGREQTRPDMFVSPIPAAPPPTQPHPSLSASPTASCVPTWGGLALVVTALTRASPPPFLRSWRACIETSGK